MLVACVIGALLILLFGAVTLAALAFGDNIDGRDDPASQCSRSSDVLFRRRPMAA